MRFLVTLDGFFQGLLSSGYILMGCIYLFTNRMNGKQYVGKTKWDLMKRDHAAEVRGGSQRLFIRALRKYGMGLFDSSVLFESEDEQLLFKAEREAIQYLETKHPNGYNLTDGGEGSSGYIFTEEDRQKVSKGLKGKRKSESHRESMRRAWRKRVRGQKRKPLSQQTKERISNALLGNKNGLRNQGPLGKTPWNKGKTFSEESRRKMSESHKGKRLSAETKAKLSKALKGRVFTEEHKAKLSLSQIGNKKRLGKKNSPEHNAKIGKGNKGKIRSIETREKISQTLKKCHADQILGLKMQEAA